MDTIGTRLRNAIERWGSIRRFQQEMRKRNVKGSSYPRIHDYLKDKITPTQEFLLAAADLMGVRASWLIDGEGETTIAEAAQERVILEERYEPVAEEVEGLIAWEFETFPKLPAAARALVWETFQHHNSHALSVSIWTGEPKLSHRAIARSIGNALRAPLDSLGIDLEDLPVRQIGEYVEFMCHALKMLVPEPFARGPIIELAPRGEKEWSTGPAQARHREEAMR